MLLKEPKLSNKIINKDKLYINPKIKIDKFSDLNNNKVIALSKINYGEIIIKEYSIINLFGEKVEDRDVSFIKKLILESESELFPRKLDQYKRTKMTKQIFDKINKITNKTLKKFFEKYNDELIEYYYAKHLFNSFEGNEYGPLYLPNIAKLNHSCNPNTSFSFDRTTGIMTLVATREIQKNEELTDSYLLNKKIDLHKTYLEEHYAFQCDCVKILLK